MEDSPSETVGGGEYEGSLDLPLCRTRGERGRIISGIQVLW